MDLSDLKAMVASAGLRGGQAAPSMQVVADSRAVRPGDVFVALRGVSVDGHDFIPAALERRAGFIVAQRPIDAPAGVAVVQVADSATALGELAQLQWGEPSKRMAVLGVTGTNGKTTVAYLAQAMLRAAGIDCGMIGTIGYDAGAGCLETAENTTPSAVRLAELLGRMRRRGMSAAVMEVSSHALDQRRTAGINFSAAAFTNLTGDHLDYHVSSEAYFDAKARLFEGLSPSATAIINADDSRAEQLRARTRARLWRFGLDATADDLELTAHLREMSLAGSVIDLRVLGESITTPLRIVGSHNVSNVLAAAGLARAAGASLEHIAQAAAEFPGAPGRLERVDDGGKFAVLVDYAHTDDALANVLRAVRGLSPRRIILVFGCGGDRDRTKRPRMARQAQQGAEVIIVTNDNPRTEAPERIFADIRVGFDAAERDRVSEIADRRAAIAQAIAQARPGDVVLIAGKGHEDYQIIGREKRHFDDREIARQILRAGLVGAADAADAQRKCPQNVNATASAQAF